MAFHPYSSGQSSSARQSSPRSGRAQAPGRSSSGTRTQTGTRPERQAPPRTKSEESSSSGRSRGQGHDSRMPRMTKKKILIIVGCIIVGLALLLDGDYIFGELASLLLVVGLIVCSYMFLLSVSPTARMIHVLGARLFEHFRSKRNRRDDRY